VLTSRLTQCPFAIKGGGQTVFLGLLPSKAVLRYRLSKRRTCHSSRVRRLRPLNLGTAGMLFTQSLRIMALSLSVGTLRMWRLEPYSEVTSRILRTSTALPRSSLHSYETSKTTLLTLSRNIAPFEVVAAPGMVLNVTSTSFPTATGFCAEGKLLRRRHEVYLGDKATNYAHMGWYARPHDA
jgi:hypothetical protein